jgi:hypothetical protein
MAMRKLILFTSGYGDAVQHDDLTTTHLMFAPGSKREVSFSTSIDFAHV